MRPLRYLNGRTLSPVPAEARQWARPKWRSASASWASPPRFSWTVTASFANASSDSSTLRHSNPPCSSCCKTLVGTLKAWSSTVPFTAHQKKSTLVNKRGACMLHVKQGMVVFVVLLCASFSLQAGPRKEKLRRWEFGGHYTLLNIPSNRVGCGGCRANNSGFGGRLGYNFYSWLGVESEINFFPDPGQGATNLDGGRITQGLFGVKAGVRRQKW